MTTPRLRPELHATPIEDQGLKFFDISDPRSGGRMRLYDHEWLLASQMDGHKSLDDIARWAHGTLHLDVTGSSLAAYAERLAELGFIATPEPTPSLPARDPHALSGATTPLPPAAPAGHDDGEDVPIELTAEEDETVTTKQDALPARAPVVEPPRPQLASVRTDATERQATLPGVGETTVTRDPEATSPSPSSSRSMMGLLVVLLIIGGVVAYVTMMGSSGAKVSTQIARTREVVALYDGSSRLGQAPPRTLAFGEAGKVTEVVAAGTEVKEGTPLATLDGFAKVEKELADVKDRLGFYQKQLDAAVAKNEPATQQAAEAKVAEKKKLLGELEARAGKLRLVAPGPGLVDKVDVAAGADVKADAPAVELHDNRVLATFSLTGGGALKAGEPATLQGASGNTAAAKIAKVDGGTITVEVMDGASVKPGDEVRLVKSKLAGVVVVPATAVVKKDGADTVFVFSQGVVHAKRVTIAERAGTEIYVSAGLTAGDQVVTSGGDALNDGDKASTGT